MRGFTKQVYRAARALLFATILAVVALYLILYVLTSVPGVRNFIVEKASGELSSLLKSRVEIGSVDIFPFNEVRLYDVKVYEPDSTDVLKPCLSVKTLGAGIELNELLKGKLVFSYAELSQVKIRITQEEKNSPYNIQFIIDAFKPKEKNEPSNFSLKIRTIAIRELSASYDLLWKPRKNTGFDPSHLQVSELRADISLSRLETLPLDLNVRVRRIAFILDHKLDVNSLGFTASLNDDVVEIKDLHLKLPDSELETSDFSFCLEPKADKNEGIFNRPVKADLFGSISPRDLSLFVPWFQDINEVFDFNISGITDLRSVSQLEIFLKSPSLGFDFQASGNIEGIEKPSGINGNITIDKLFLTPEISALINKYIHFSTPSLSHAVAVVGSPSLTLKGEISKTRSDAPFVFNADGKLDTDIGSIQFAGKGELQKSSALALTAQINSPGLDIAELAGRESLGTASFDLKTDFRLNKGSAEGSAEIDIPWWQLPNARLENISISAEKTDNRVNVKTFAESELLNLDLAAWLELAGPESVYNIESRVESLSSDLIGAKGKFAGGFLSGEVRAAVSGQKIDNFSGILKVSDLSFIDNTGKTTKLKNLYVDSETGADGKRKINIASDIVDADIKGCFKWSELPIRFGSLLSGLLPAVNPLSPRANIETALTTDDTVKSNINIDMTVYPDEELADFFNLPVCPLTEATLSAEADFIEKTAKIDISAPFLRKGKNKLIEGTSINIDLLSPANLNLDISSILPFKNSQIPVEGNLRIYGNDAKLTALINQKDAGKFHGKLCVEAQALHPGTPELILSLKSTSLHLNGEQWNADEGTIFLSNNKICADNLKIGNNSRFFRIDGRASTDPADKLAVQLKDIDLSYIFDILNIDYVKFGGLASGLVYGSSLLSGKPKAYTEGLKARDFSYGGALLGDADLKGVFHADDKRVEIGADIRNKEGGNALADGNIWIGRDSLSFNFDAERLNVSFIEQFMSAFASEIRAEASGNCKLFGTFKNIDLRGKMFVDTLDFKLDFTGVSYSGSDSVILEKGRIRIPGFNIFDRDGHKGVFSGELRHNYLHDMRFDFRLRDAKRLLSYDLPKGPDDVWWGTVYASGNASILGVPGLVDINVDMTSEQNSSFFFELSDSEAARDYNFLSFTDKTIRNVNPEEEAPQDFKSLFRKKVKEQDNQSSTNVHFDLRLNVTPSLNMTMVMDPVSGDKITGRGYGPMQIQYETEKGEVRMYGKYSITEGLYNFSLQDVILRDFRIEDGSTISFNGDPLSALLNIRAAYRVNTSLTDLDKSFASDRDLNRTNVPVDAMLIVSGPLDSPDIDFDLEFPTLTEEVARKVRSIVSTNDLMSRQIIYLLALNRFYTPEYMDSQSTGGELTSVASSTISSQLGNALSQLTDKLDVMPSIRSDKGDFSDLEMDLALSSRLLNNRLLINGNFGYRDRTTSTTTFIGDFDVQYLLNKRGTFRLKAYNHFNDQNYYLRQALTTQGLGIEFRHDFNRFLSFLRPKKSFKEMTDTISGQKKIPLSEIDHSKPISQ